MMVMDATFKDGRLSLTFSNKIFSVVFEEFSTSIKHNIEHYKTLEEADIAFNVRCEAPDPRLPCSHYGTLQKGFKK